MAKAKKAATPEQLKKREQSTHARQLRALFQGFGFQEMPHLREKDILFEGIQSELDGVFVHENVILITEFTTHSDCKAHLNKKAHLYTKILQNPQKFTTDIVFSSGEQKFHKNKYKIRILYCSKYGVDDVYKSKFSELHYLDDKLYKYFYSVQQSVKKSGRFEFLAFFGIDAKDLETQMLPIQPFAGSVLPESQSNFADHFKVVSFYATPDWLLKNCFVLRADGWREENGLYQRMISPYKIKKIRDYLIDQQRVFVNNIIVTLPSSTLLRDNNNKIIDASEIADTCAARIEVPTGFNSVGIIDGQHRVFAYHEGGKNDSTIKNMREQLNLLVTGIVTPTGLSTDKRTAFESRLFLEINSNQSSAKSGLKQTIGLLIYPHSEETVARRIANSLNDKHGPLQDKFEKPFETKHRMKITSIVSYGIKPLIKFSGDDSLMRTWANVNKGDLSIIEDMGLTNEYITYCAKVLNEYFSAIRQIVPNHLWTADSKIKGRLLNTNNMVGLLWCQRLHIEKYSKVIDAATVKSKMASLDSFDFSAFKSSQFSALGQALFDQYF